MICPVRGRVAVAEVRLRLHEVKTCGVTEQRPHADPHHDQHADADRRGEQVRARRTAQFAAHVVRIEDAVVVQTMNGMIATIAPKAAPNRTRRTSTARDQVRVRARVAAVTANA